MSVNQEIGSGGQLAEKLLSLQHRLFSLVYPSDIFSVQRYLPVSQPLIAQLLVDECLKKSANQ